MEDLKQIARYYGHKVEGAVALSCVECLECGVIIHRTLNTQSVWFNDCVIGGLILSSPRVSWLVCPKLRALV